MDKLKVVLPEGAGSILAAVSGGADSVALLALLAEAAEERGVRLTAAHFEHGIRGEASLADAAFVRGLCDLWRIPLIEGSADVPALAALRSVGLEEAARDARYEFLRRAAGTAGADFIALAHHRDDQAETVLMHLMRGSGLRGLVGMREIEGDLYRPLLGYPKEALVGYLRERSIPWREDATNSEADTPRNGLRLEVIPRAERFYPGARRAISRFSEIAAAEDDFINQETGRFLNETLISFPGGCLIEMPVGGAPHMALLMRAVHRLTGLPYEAVKRAAGLSGEAKGAHDLEAGWRAERGRRGIYLLDGSWKGLTERPLPLNGEMELDGLGRMSVSAGAGVPVKNDDFCQELDADALKGAVVRTRRDGDVIHPLGAPGRQKLKDYFINRHIDRPLRDRIPLIARENEILWAAGCGISEEAKLRRGSRAVRLELTGWPVQKGGGKNDA